MEVEFSWDGTALANQFSILMDEISFLAPANEADFRQVIDYRYNIRGWLTRINDSDIDNSSDEGPRDYFGMNIGYNDDIGIVTDQSYYEPQYNGNISAIKWSSDLGMGAPSLQERTELVYSIMMP
jgi:hypothetical protein